MLLPWPIEPTEWRMVTPELRRTKSGIFDALEAEFRRCCEKPGWNPGLVAMGGHMVAIDYCAKRDGEFHSYKTARDMDHPFLAKLDAMPHVPRAVKHIYRRGVRLKYLFAKEGWDFQRDWERANEAWEKYTAAIRTGRMK